MVFSASKFFVYEIVCCEISKNVYIIPCFMKFIVVKLDSGTNSHMENIILQKNRKARCAIHTARNPIHFISKATQ